MKLDRFIARHQAMGRTAAHHRIAEKRVRVNGVIVTDGHHPVNEFSRIEFDDTVLQAGARALYLMMHKPAGTLSATVDDQHPTVLDLIDDPDRHTLHLAGRLDRASTGLLILTNDGRWSKKLTDASAKVEKAYLVETREPIHQDAVEAFARGFYFHTEDITTLPARLEILDDRLARVTLHEGRYHQIKRMFHRVSNRVARLHRERIGGLHLPADLPAGAWRELSAAELVAIAST